jgi:hypothetical protein
MTSKVPAMVRARSATVDLGDLTAEVLAAVLHDDLAQLADAVAALAARLDAEVARRKARRE